MHIWVDADACPKVIREILWRAAHRTRISTIFVANRPLRLPPSPVVQMRQVPSGFDVADNYIVSQVQKGDLVITADIPLASSVIEKGAIAINPRGTLYTQANIYEALSMRDFMANLRDSGVETGGPAAFSQADSKTFAGQLDRLLINIK